MESQLQICGAHDHHTHVSSVPVHAAGREEPLLHVAGVGSEEVTQEGLGTVPSTQQPRCHTAWLQVVGCVSLANSSLDLHAVLRRTWEKDL